MFRKFALIGIICTASVAGAQPVMTATSTSADPLALAGFDPENATAPQSVVTGAGVKVGDGTVLHPTFGLETGVVSNVFYEQQAPQGAGVLRLMAQIGAASLGQERLNPASGGLGDENHHDTDNGDLQYEADLRVAYDQMLSSNETVRSTGGLGLGAVFRGMVKPMGTVSLGFSENYVRLIRASNFETSTDATRDVNTLGLQLLIHPPGRSVSGYAYYGNTIDVFENSSLAYPNRIDHRIGVHPMWHWLPETLIYGDVSLGIVSGIGSSAASQAKASSLPLTAILGASTLLSLKTTLKVEAGYTRGFYSSGPDFSSPTVNATLGYRYSPLGRVAVSYSLLYTDSINANYFRDHVIRLIVQQGFAPFVVVVQPELHFREYNGFNVPGVTAGTVRDDTIFAIVGGIHYNFRDSVAATLDYHFSTVQTNFRYMDVSGQTIDPSYVRHELLLGVRAAL